VPFVRLAETFAKHIIPAMSDVASPDTGIADPAKLGVKRAPKALDNDIRMLLYVDGAATWLSPGRAAALSRRSTSTHAARPQELT
jgi:hypothetical protein